MATELDTIRKLYRYHLRKLRSYLRIIWSIPVDERYRDRGSTFPSLVDIYLHILDDYRFWFIQAYTGKPFKDYPLGIRLSRAEAERATADEMEAVRRFIGQRHATVKFIPVVGSPTSMIVKTGPIEAAEIRESLAGFSLSGRRVSAVLTSGSIGKLKRRASSGST